MGSVSQGVMSGGKTWLLYQGVEGLSRKQWRRDGRKARKDCPLQTLKEARGNGGGLGRDRRVLYKLDVVIKTDPPASLDAIFLITGWLN